MSVDATMYVLYVMAPSHVCFATYIKYGVTCDTQKVFLTRFYIGARHTNRDEQIQKPLSFTPHRFLTWLLLVALVRWTFRQAHKSKKIHLLRSTPARSDRLSDGSRTYALHRLIKYLNKVHVFAVLTIDNVFRTIVSYRLVGGRAIFLTWDFLIAPPMTNCITCGGTLHITHTHELNFLTSDMH